MSKQRPSVWPNKVGLFRTDSLAKHLLHFAYVSSVVAIDKTNLRELVKDVPPLWEQRDKNYHNRDLKPKLWDETGEKLNITGKYLK